MEDLSDDTTSNISQVSGYTESEVEQYINIRQKIITCGAKYTNTTSSVAKIEEPALNMSFFKRRVSKRCLALIQLTMNWIYMKKNPLKSLKMIILGKIRSEERR